MAPRPGLAGVDPASALQGLTYAEVDLRSPLMAAATPVLDDLGDQLSETVFSTLLVEPGRPRRAAVVRHPGPGARLRRPGGSPSGSACSRRRSAPTPPAPSWRPGSGSRCTARSTTRCRCATSAATATRSSTRSPAGSRASSTSPASRRPPTPSCARWSPRAVADIEQRLLDGSRVSETELLHAFQAASGRRRAVVAMLDDLTMSNRTALDLLGQVDLTLLRMLAQDVGSTGLPARSPWSPGWPPGSAWSTCRAPAGGSLVHVEPLARPRSPRNRTTPVSRVATGPALVAGAPGTGRTTYAPGSPATTGWRC